MDDPAREVIHRQRKSDPTPEEIRQKCWEIQDGWNETERRHRAAWYDEERTVALPIIPLDDEGV